MLFENYLTVKNIIISKLWVLIVLCIPPNMVCKINDSQIFF